MKDLKIRIISFLNRVLRYFVFSSILSFGACLTMIIINLFAGVLVSVGFYFMLFAIFDLALTTLICVYNSNKLFAPMNKRLIMKLERERLEKARRSRRKNNKKIS
ncbi:CobD/CbiB family protein [Peptostreptococcus faecalis]|uniref:hypothetical protein n=1 Tax=Peptostreptococcus faecalis TaxID=2045015 RepID=UPI000C7BD09C|nr:hypothetical protein [Peptostreptococcus faecalis]